MLYFISWYHQDHDRRQFSVFLQPTAEQSVKPSVNRQVTGHPQNGKSLFKDLWVSSQELAILFYTISFELRIILHFIWDESCPWRLCCIPCIITYTTTQARYHERCIALWFGKFKLLSLSFPFMWKPKKITPETIVHRFMNQYKHSP